MLLSTFEGIFLTQIDSEDQKFFSQKSEEKLPTPYPTVTTRPTS